MNVLSFHRKTAKTIQLDQFHISDATHLVDEPLQVFEILGAVEQTVHYDHRLVSNHRSPETRTKQWV